jgi:hypothetical protein
MTKKLGTVLQAALLLAWIVAILSGGCAEKEPTTQTDLGEVIFNSGDLDSIIVRRFVDREYENVCYLFTGYKMGGISCLPLEGQ